MDIIYKLTSPSGNVYIGRTKNFNKRMQQHELRSKRDTKNTVLYNAIKKYGWDNFTKEIIAEVNSKDAPEVEFMMMIKYNSVKNGYNMTYSTNGGDVWDGRRDTQQYLDYIKLLSENGKKYNNFTNGYKHTEENVKKMSHPLEKNPMYGKKHSDESREKLKSKAKGRFTLDWYIDRNGKEEGTKLYEERRLWLKNRNLKKDENGRFVKAG
jgi:group I intron endonuclease